MYYYFYSDPNGDQKCEKLYELQKKLQQTELQDMAAYFDDVQNTVFEILLLCKGCKTNKDGRMFDVDLQPIASAAAYIAQEKLLSEAAAQYISGYEPLSKQNYEKLFAAFTEVVQEIAGIVRKNEGKLSDGDRPETLAEAMEQLVPALQAHMAALIQKEAPSRLEVYRSKLQSAEDIDSCEKVAAFVPDGQHNYLFISYSHKDYKQVYSDIANLRFAGVRVWYDEGLDAGKDWREEVGKYLADPCCSGVIFYLSEELFISKSILHEVKLVNGNKPYFSVNLTDRQPSQILKSCITKIESHIDDMDWLHQLSGTFKDSATYLSWSAASHDKNILRQVRRQFNVTIDQAPEPDQLGQGTVEQAIDKTIPNNDSFLINNGVLSKYIGNDTRVIVPDSVKVVGDCAFRGCENMQVCVLPDGLTWIGSRAFEECGNLTSINIPESVSRIDSYAFARCRALQAIRIPKSVTAIDSYTFSGCYSLQRLILPEKLNSLGSHAFEGCSGLRNIRIPDGIGYIGDGSFASCCGLEGVVIPEGAYAIGDAAFSNCNSLKGVSIPNSIQRVGEYAFAGCSALGSLTFRGFVAEIGKAAFKGCYRLRLIDMYLGYLEEIQPETFEGCRDLEQIKLVDGINCIGDRAFKDCWKLRTVTVPDSVRHIGSLAFGGCHRLKVMTLPGTMESIGQAAFFNCYSLSEIKVPQGVENIENETFSGCVNLKKIHVPTSLKSIGEQAFCGCKSLEELSLYDVTSIARSAFRGCRQVRICAARDSYAHKYARKHWLRFRGM